MTLRTIRSLGCKAGVSLNPGTPISAIEPVLGDLDLILVMTVNPGWGGQSPIQMAIDKVSVLREMLDARGLPDVLIEVDGGVKVDNIVDFAAADVFVSGSGIFKSGDYAGTISAMRDALHACS
jgi:ribulose-phosphate 3-epimerase